MEKKNLIKYIRKFIPIIGLALFVYIIIGIGIGDIIDAFKQIPIHLYLVASIITVPRFLLYAYKWKYISKKQKMDLKFFYLLKVTMKVLFFSTITPGGIGYHLRIYYLKQKTKAHFSKCIANSLIDLSVGFLAGFFLALIGSLLIIDKFPELLPIILAGFIFFFSAFVVLVKKKIGSKLFRILLRPFIPGKYKEKIDKSIESLYEDIPRLRDMIWPFVIEIFVWLLAAFQVYILSLAFNLNVPFIIFIFCSIISVVSVAMLPISVGGLGVREGVFGYLLLGFGVNLEIAVVLSLAGYFVKTLFPGIIGLIISFVDKDKIVIENEEI